MLMLIFLLRMILFLHRSIILILLCLKTVRLYITHNRRQLVFLIDRLKPFRRVNNRAVTWNRTANNVQRFLGKSLQRTTTNSILHYVNRDAFQRGCIDQMVFIIADINTRIGIGGSYPNPTLWTCLKITHIIEEIFLCLIILFKSLCDLRTRFQHIGLKKRIFYNLLHLFHIFCYLLSDTCSHTCLSWTTLILFIRITTTIINGTILSLLLRVNSIHGNQPPPSLNHMRMFTHNLMAYVYLGSVFKGNKMINR